MVERMNQLGVKSKRLGYVIAASPQLLVRSLGEFNEVRSPNLDGMLQIIELIFMYDVICNLFQSQCIEMLHSTIFGLIIPAFVGEQVVDFLLKIGVEETDLGGMLKRHPGVFASDVESTLEPKVQFLRDLGMKEDVLFRVLRFYPEMLTMRIEESLRPRSDFTSLLNSKVECFANFL
jgi:mTERF domain-containing protein